MSHEIVKQTVAGREIRIETGKMAKQANGSVTLHIGDMVILAAATMSKAPREGADFFPLTIEIVERMYASGKIAGGFFKREARPSTHATLTARLIDRPIRPSFPKEFFHDVQVVLTVLSYDPTLPYDFLGIIAASAALSVSDIPFSGPVGAALVCEVDGELKINPSVEEISRSTLEMIVAGTQDAVLMIEAKANQVPEERVIEAIELAHESIKEVVVLQSQLADRVNKTKFVHEPPAENEALKQDIKSFMGDKISQNLQAGHKKGVETFLAQLEADVCEKFVKTEDDNSKEVKRLFSQVKKDQIRQVVIQQKVRPDGRGLDEIRPISTEVGLLPSVHGSALFTRGETQSLGTITLGSASDEQTVDGLAETVKESYYFHYNFPPYSVGETGFLRTSRRELGHGALAQRALQPILPEYADFPYTIRIVSEILESNGSSSMASVCSGSLALMDCGVPVKAPVSGIAMGLLMDGQDYIILSDIQGLEDHYGDMDFKVAGTREGINALQLDIKISGLSHKILVEALAQAKKGRLHILDVMEKELAQPRAELSPNAPKIEFIKIDPEKVGALIGPGGKMIRKIEEESGATVFVMDGAEGDVSISAKNTESMAIAMRMVKLVATDLKPGDVFDGRVVKIVNFGAFIELIGTGKEALLHISKVTGERIDRVEDFLEVGQALEVEVAEIDTSGRISLSRPAK